MQQQDAEKQGAHDQEVIASDGMPHEGANLSRQTLQNDAPNHRPEGNQHVRKAEIDGNVVSLILRRHYLDHQVELTDLLETSHHESRHKVVDIEVAVMLRATKGPADYCSNQPGESTGEH